MWAVLGKGLAGKQYGTSHSSVLLKNLKIHTTVRTFYSKPARKINILIPSATSNTPPSKFRSFFSNGSNNWSHGSQQGRRHYSSSYFSNDRGNQVLYGIIGANIVIFIGWNTIGSSTPEGARFMRDNFTVSLSNTLSGRLHTYVTACFSQIAPAHLLFNMLGLYMFGPAVLAMVGPGRFLGLYLAAGLVGNLFHMGGVLYRYNFNTQQVLRYDRTCLGASGSVTAISVINALAYPFQTWYLFMVVPVPGIVAVGAFLGYDIFMAQWGNRTGVAHLAHIGGALAGAAYYFLIRRRLIRF